MRSPRLRYERLDVHNLSAFYELSRDEHVRHYLLDGSLVNREWAEAEIARSDACFERGELGLWVAYLDGEAMGFCGYRHFEDLSPEPQLLYAMPARHAGHGYATEMARRLIEAASELGWSRLVTAVDAPNRASIRVLEKTGFAACGRIPGAFGDTILFERWAGERPVRWPDDAGTELTLDVASTWDGDACPPDEVVSLQLRVDSDELCVTVDAPFHADEPPAATVGSTPSLWQHEVVELMLLGDDERYLEVELSPHGHYLVLMLHGARNIVHQGLLMHHRARITDRRWRGQARIPVGWLPAGCQRVNAYAMHGAGHQRRYLAWRPPGGSQPDFHRLSSFGPLTSL